MDAHHLALSSLITLYFFLYIQTPSYCTDYERFANCSRPFECGSIQNVSYPFWGGDRPEYCGREGFKLECQENEIPIIRFEALDFRVLKISESLPIMTIARSDLWDGSCPQNNFNTTLNFTNFDYSYASAFQNITLFYDCPPQVKIPVPNWFTCKSGDADTGNNAYFVEEFLSTSQLQYYKKCSKRIRVPILRAALMNYPWSGVGALWEVLNLGFDVVYNPCSGCEHSGGHCGSNVERSYGCPGKNMLALFSFHFPGLGYSILLVLGLVLMVYT
ncbi:LEAF RUST 10 DISEASE-RESISTANCE LOCUS RECEPTOR-LIKE PROTEIN KINASE-like 2.5 [Quercus robur]|uniref:LEAF RUST 10 DISEASE-RESISTANCE LOCUS RECEPTOR-LIKE PROTEIN KINASE-like 2.5 n=1 Tax=Quercus robur TaxID=38942 RepID=UPI002162C42F|nr:LEAF RUST 10 DISEASE-RESISTANCE LOCUS RECEPTOR-LIKE PROTEIN KINASE-like 2.5 [Quercus robur]